MLNDGAIVGITTEDGSSRRAPRAVLLHERLVGIRLSILGIMAMYTQKRLRYTILLVIDCERMGYFCPPIADGILKARVLSAGRMHYGEDANAWYP